MTAISAYDENIFYAPHLMKCSSYYSTPALYQVNKAGSSPYCLTDIFYNSVNFPPGLSGVDLQFIGDEDISLEQMDFKRSEREMSMLDYIIEAFRRLLSFIFCCDSDETIGVELTEEFREIVLSLPEDIQQQLYQNLHKVSIEEHAIALDLYEHLSPLSDTERGVILTKLFLGAYVIIDDNGDTYHEWVQRLENKVHRISSHESNDKQYAVRGSIYKEFLFSKKTIELPDGTTKEVTWFQMERYPAKFGCYLAHLWTWLLYKCTGENQGPYGSTPHRETSDPLIIYRHPPVQSSEYVD